MDRRGMKTPLTQNRILQSNRPSQAGQALLLGSQHIDQLPPSAHLFGKVRLIFRWREALPVPPLIKVDCWIP